MTVAANAKESAPVANSKHLVLIRGIPGSGKSTHARKHFPGHDMWEADTFHTDVKTGEYNWKAENQGKAHQWCQGMTRRSMEQGRAVVVSNTFTKMWEMKPYLDMAKEFGYRVEVIRMETRFKNVHNVPEEQVKRMEDRFEDYPGEKVVR